MGDYASNSGYMAASHHTSLNKPADPVIEFLFDMSRQNDRNIPSKAKMLLQWPRTLVFFTLHRSQAFKTCLRLTRKIRCSRFSSRDP